MKQILLKNIYLQRYLLLAGGTGVLATLFLPATVQPVFLLLPHILLLFIVVVLGVIMAESNEEKNNGYLFLSTLPISRFGIASGSFLLIFLECAGFSLVSWLILSMKMGMVFEPAAIQIIIALSFTVSLVIGGVTQLGVYALGLKNFTRAMLVVTIGIQMVIFLSSVDRFAGGNRMQNSLAVVEKVLSLSPILIGGLGLLIWAVLFFLTSQFRKQI